MLRPIPPEVSAQVAEYSRELGIDDSLLHTVEQFASGDLAMAAAELEAFALIARANDDPRPWSLPAMVISLFENRLASD